MGSSETGECSFPVSRSGPLFRKPIQGGRTLSALPPSSTQTVAYPGSLSTAPYQNMPSNGNGSPLSFNARRAEPIPRSRIPFGESFFAHAARRVTAEVIQSSVRAVLIASLVCRTTTSRCSAAGRSPARPLQHLVSRRTSRARLASSEDDLLVAEGRHQLKLSTEGGDVPAEGGH
jgi:hypothetical protein